MPALPTPCPHLTFQCLAAFKLSAEAEWQRARALIPDVFGYQLQTLKTHLGKDSKGKQEHFGSHVFAKSDCEASIPEDTS